jgi:NAD-dependent dihydropyrimidine dehydrogenase PreA subunit
MSHPIINAEECSACGICVDTCEQSVLDIVGDAATVVNEDACTACGDCMEECPMGAIEEIDED